MFNIELISIDKGTQSRIAISQDTVDDYARQMEDGAKFPPVIVFHDGVEYYLADGFHRYFANRKLKRDSIDVDVVKGTLREAILYSLKANKAHGLRPSIEDKRNMVTKMLTDHEWKEWADREIARHCGVSHVFVAKMRKEVSGGEVQATRKFKTKGGNVSTFTNRQPEPEPEAPAYDEKQEMLDALVAENEKLSEQLAIATIDGTVEEKDLAQSLISEQKEEIRVLKIELVAVKKSRDMFQSENAQLKKQVAMLQKKLKAHEDA
jgi:ParB-like chromosome segregation protein Spo0J